MSGDHVLLFAIGFLAQLIDGGLGMAFGVVSTTAMLSIGMSPAQASAIVHTAEIFTTGASAASHLYYRNVEWRLVGRLGVAGVIGAVLGAWILSNVDATAVRPFVSAYLLVLGIFILIKAITGIQSRQGSFKYAPPLGLIGGFLDASGGGGWGPIVTSTLIGSGQAPRTSVGSVNATEFFVATAAATTFFVELGTTPLNQLFALVIGGVLAAPFGGLIARYISARVLMTAVGLFVVVLALLQLARTFTLI